MRKSGNTLPICIYSLRFIGFLSIFTILLQATYSMRWHTIKSKYFWLDSGPIDDYFSINLYIGLLYAIGTMRVLHDQIFCLLCIKYIIIQSTNDLNMMYGWGWGKCNLFFRDSVTLLVRLLFDNLGIRLSIQISFRLYNVALTQEFKRGNFIQEWDMLLQGVWKQACRVDILSCSSTLLGF